MSMPTILDDQLQELLLQMEQFGRENDQRENDRQRKMLNLERDSAVLIQNVAGFSDPDVDDRACSKALQAANFDLPPLSHYSLAATTRGFVFGFTAFRPWTIRAMLKRAALHLCSALKGG